MNQAELEIGTIEKEQPINRIVGGLRFRDLYYLSVLAEVQNFSRAAELCDISQPALSNQIRKVEDLLNVRIFERNSRNVSVTSIGAEIVKYGNLLLQSAREMDNMAHRFATN